MKLSTKISALSLSATEQAEVLHELVRLLPVVPVELVTRTECLSATVRRLQKELEDSQADFEWPIPKRKAQ